MNENPREPLHRSPLNQQRSALQKNGPSETPMPDTPKLSVPDYGDKPEQTPQVEAGVKSRKKPSPKKRFTTERFLK